MLLALRVLGRVRASVCGVIFFFGGGGGGGVTQLYSVPATLLTDTSSEYHKCATAENIDFIYCLFQTIITV
jgi:hypothetical protein